MSQQFPNDVAETRTKIIPGPIKGTCPPFKEIMVIDARKVFDFCFQEDILDRCFFVPEVGTGAEILDCEIVDVTCVEIMEREPIPETGGLALVSLQVTLTLRITLIPTTGATPIVINRPLAFPKRVVVCAPDGTDVNCDVRGTCICTLQPVVNQVTTTEPNVCCTIQLCIVVQVTADVKILVPTFGFVMPKECQVAPAFGGCPPIPPSQACLPEVLRP